MKIENVDIRLLKPYKNNPRVNIEAIDKLAESIKEFGFKVPIVINKDYVIINGHTRYEASKKLGLKTIPAIVADDLSEEQQKAFRLVDNKTHDFAQWNYKLLDDELDVISLDMGKYGFIDDNLVFIDDILNSGLAGEGNEKELFGLKIYFDKKYENQVKNVINLFGKEMIINQVISVMEEK